MYSVEETMSMLSDIYDFELAAGPIYENLAVAEHYYHLTGDSEFVTEGFSDMLTSITNVFKTLIEKITKFFKDILRAIMSHSMDLKDFVKNYKTELDNLGDVDFEISGYDFNVLNSKKPDMSEFQQIIQSYNGAIAAIDKLTKEYINDQRVQWFKEDNLDKIRADVLGVSTPIRASSFADEIQKCYRGDTETKVLKITNSEVNKIVSHVDQLYNCKKDATEDRDKILRLLNQAEIFFSRKVDTVYKGTSKVLMFKTLDSDQAEGKLSEGEQTTTNSSYLQIFQNMISFKYDQTRTISAIISQVVTERAKAFVAQIKQERAILGKALTNSKNRSEVSESTAVTELFGFGKKKDANPDPSNGYMVQEDYDRIVKTYKSKKTLPPSTGIDSAAWIICGYKPSDLDKFCNEKDTKLFADVMTSECTSEGKKNPINPGPKSVVRFYSNDTNVDFYYCKDNKKIYGVYDDFSDFTNGTTSSFDDLYRQIEFGLKYIGIYYTSVYKPATEENLLFEARQIWMDYYREHILELTDQSRSIIAAIESGNPMEPVTEGALKNLTDKIRKLINQIIDAFKNKMNLRDEQYGPWIRNEDVVKSITESLKTFDEPLSIIPFWDGHVQSDFQGISTILGSMERGLKDTKQEDWFKDISTFTNARSVDDLRKRAYVEELKNYFRNGDKSGKKIDPVTLDKGNAATIIPKMISYCQNFKSTTDKIAGLKRRVDAIKVTETTDWLTIENRPVNESSISVLMNTGMSRQLVLEVDDKTKDETKTENPTQVQTVQDEEQKAGRKIENDAKESVTDKTNSSTEDMNFALKYTQDVVREYCRVCEERYNVYIKTLLRICPMEVYPMFENGKYVGTKKTVQTTGKKKSTEESVDYTSYQNKPTRGLSLFKN